MWYRVAIAILYHFDSYDRFMGSVFIAPISQSNYFTFVTIANGPTEVRAYFDSGGFRASRLRLPDPGAKVGYNGGREQV